MRVVWRGAPWRRRVARLCVWLAVAGLVLAAARPLVAAQASTREGILELVVDVSGTISAADVAPTRLVAMERSALRLLDQLPPRVRVGLVSFSGSAAALARPTTDRDRIRGKLGSLFAEGPTAVGDALRLALSQIRSAGPAAPAAVLLLSDGANNQGSERWSTCRSTAFAIPMTGRRRRWTRSVAWPVSSAARGGQAVVQYLTTYATADEARALLGNSPTAVAY